MPAKVRAGRPVRRRSDVVGLPEDVAAIRKEIRRFFSIQDTTGKRIGSYQNGIYAFYDYDLEPIYVGQTQEKLSSRIPLSALLGEVNSEFYWG